MSTEVTILGLGLKSYQWKQFSSAVSNSLKTIALPHEIHSVSKGWGNFSKKALVAMDQKDPDLVLLSLDAFEDIQGLVQFFQDLQLDNSPKKPLFFLIVEAKLPFLKNLLLYFKDTSFHFQGFGPVRLANLWQIAIEKQDCFLSITPTPHLLLKPRVVPKNGYIALEQIEEVHWKEESYQPLDFFHSQVYLNREHQPIESCQGLWQVGESICLRKAFFLTDLVGMATSQFRVEKLLTSEELRYSDSIEYIVESAKQKLLKQWTEEEKNSLTYIQSFVPLSLYCLDPVALKMFRYHLHEAGFQNLPVAAKAKQSLQLLFSPGSQEEGENLTFYQDPLIREIQGIEDEDGTLLNLHLPPTRLISLDEIQQERNELDHQVKALFEKEKQLSNKKVFLRQEDDQKADLFRKVALFEKLAKRAITVENEETKPLENPHESVVIFYDDPADASNCNRSLASKGKTLFVDLGDIETVSALGDFDTTGLEPFTESGKVFLLADKARLESIVWSLNSKLPKVEKEELVVEEDSLALEGTKLDQELDYLLYLHYWHVTKELIQVHLPKILEASRLALPEIERQIFQYQDFNKVMVLGMDKKEQEILKSVLNICFPTVAPLATAFHFIPFALQEQLDPIDRRGLSSEQEKELLTHKNLERLEEYMEEVFYYLYQEKPEMLLLNSNLGLMLPVVNQIRQDSRLMSLPVFGLMEGHLREQECKRLTDMGVRLLFNHPTFFTKFAESSKL